MIDKGQWGGIWPGHRDYTPTLYEKCHGIFNDHRESGPRFNVSSERRHQFVHKFPHGHISDNAKSLMIEIL